MSDAARKKHQKHLINLIGRRTNNTSNFALLLGAGASVSSGVKPTSDMIAEWRKQVYECSKSSQPFNKWVQKQPWYKDEEEYSILFEKVYDEPSQRRTYIEACVKDATPSWGFIYLANIIAQNYFNVVFTPNFDDLINEACFTYADLRPIVCAHDSAVSGIRVTSTRPKIIKLHGDFLYDSIKNTLSETNILENNMREKLKQFATEYGLVVVGYGGHDNSIMDILIGLKNSKGYFPGGLYWCSRKNSKVSRKVSRLLRLPNVYWVEIEGFDQFMAELHKGLNLTLPNIIANPFRATTDKMNRFVVESKSFDHPTIKSDVKRLESQIKRFEKVMKDDVEELIPYEFLGMSEYNRKRYKKAIPYLEKAREQNPRSTRVSNAIMNSYNATGNHQAALSFAKRWEIEDPGFHSATATGVAYGWLERFKDSISSLEKAFDFAESEEQQSRTKSSISYALLSTARWKDALSNAEEALHYANQQENRMIVHVATISKSAALKRLHKKKDAFSILKKLLSTVKDRYRRAQVFSLLENKKGMLRELRASIKENGAMARARAKNNILFADFMDDADFRKLVFPKKREAK